MSERPSLEKNTGGNEDVVTGDSDFEKSVPQQDESADLSKKLLPSKRLKKTIVLTLKIVVIALVVVWIVRQLQKSWGEISLYDWRPQYDWLFASACFYLAAFLPSAILWNLALKWLGQKPTFFRSLKAFYVSQLGKYVPGKAMVVVIRSDMVTSETVRPSIAAVCVFYETLTMMGSGAFIAALIILCYFRENWIFSLLALGTALISCTPLLPPIFTRILKLLHIGKNDPSVQESLKNLKYRYLSIGFGLTSILWLFFGLSLWAAICGLGIQPTPLFYSLPRYVAVIALAMTLGFAVPISPGGLGIREMVLSVLLVPYFNLILTDPSNASFTMGADALATITSLLQRIVSIVAEASFVLLLYLCPFLWKLVTRRQPPQSSSSN